MTGGLEDLDPRDQPLLEGVEVQVISRHHVCVSRAQKLAEVGHLRENLQ